MSEAFDKLSKKVPVFFTGANSGEGFFSCFDEIYSPQAGDRMYILKGGPGTGKSTLMKKAAVAMSEQGEKVILCPCSSDPDSLDAVIFPEIGAAIADGTSPHVIEAKYPGVCERLVALGNGFDCDYLESKKNELLPLFAANSELHKRASRFIQAAKALNDDSFALDCEATLADKVRKTASGMADALFPVKDRESPETDTRRFLSGFTPQGNIVFENTLSLMCSRVYIVEDEYGASSSVLMSLLRARAVEAGYETVTCLCPLNPSRKIDHLIVPELKMSFCTSNSIMPVTVGTERVIHAKRFRDENEIRQYRQRLNFNSRAQSELLQGACELLENAKEIHDLIEEIYISSMNFEVINRMTDDIISELIQRSEQKHELS